MYLAFDTETSGIQNNKFQLLTAYFAILNEHLEIIDSLNIKIKWEYYIIDPKALNINKIDIMKHNNDKDSITITEASDKLLNFLNKYKVKNKFIAIGHNITFDINFIIQSKLLSKEIYYNYINPNNLDTIVLSQYMKLINKIPLTQSLSLSSLCKFLNIKVSDNFDILKTHTAEYDTLLTINLLKYYSNKEQHNNKKRKL